MANHPQSGDEITTTPNRVGFRRVVVSDYTAVMELTHHGIALDAAVASEKALMAGVDIDMMSHYYDAHYRVPSASFVKLDCDMTPVRPAAIPSITSALTDVARLGSGPIMRTLRGVEEPVLSVAEGTSAMLILPMLFGAFQPPSPHRFFPGAKNRELASILLCPAPTSKILHRPGDGR
jgi:hypothetical protein